MKNRDPMTNKTKGPIPLPEGDVPEGVRCVSLCIPDSDDAYRLLFGALYELTHWNNWDRDPEHKGTLWAKAWRTALLEGMLRCYQFRTNGGVPQFSNDGGATWSNVPAVNDGSSGYDPRTDEPLLPPRTGSNMPCLAAANATAVFVELHREVVQWYNDNAPLLACLGAIALVLGIFFPVSWAVFGLSLSSVTLATAFLTRSGILNNEAFTTEIQDELTCILYCNADSNGQWNSDEFNMVLTQIGAKTGDMWGQIGYYVEQIAGIKGLNNAGTTNSIASHDCGACSCGWCYDFNFLTTNAGMVADGFGTWITGEGWGDTLGHESSYNQRAAYPRLTASAPFVLTYLRVEYLWTKGTYDGLNATDRTMYITGDTGFVVRQDNAPDGPNSVVWAGARSMTWLELANRVGLQYGYGDPGGVTRITRLKIQGTGDPPFGTPNC